MPVKFDESRYPLVGIAYIPPVSDDDVTKFCDKMRELAGKKQPYASYFDAKGMMSLPAGQRQRMVALSKELESESEKYVVCACVVMDSPLARGVVTAINWFAPPPFEQKFFSNVDEARAYALERLKARGIVVPK